MNKFVTVFWVDIRDMIEWCKAINVFRMGKGKTYKVINSFVKFSVSTDYCLEYQ